MNETAKPAAINPRPYPPAELRKVPYNTRLPRWLCDWLRAPDRSASGPERIEHALRETYQISPPPPQKGE